LPDDRAIECRVTGRIALPKATIEIHQYRFRGPQEGMFRSSRSFLDLALSPRPGRPRGAYAGHSGVERRPLGDIIFIPREHGLETSWGEGVQRSVCCGFDDIVEDGGPGFEAGVLDAALDVRSAYVREALVRLAREVETRGFL